MLLNTYNATAKVQLVKVRTYRDAIVNSELTAQLWDSASVSGGVLAFMVKGVLTLNDDIDLSGKGFRGGIASQGNGNCQNFDATMTYESYNISSLAGIRVRESVSELLPICLSILTTCAARVPI